MHQEPDSADHPDESHSSRKPARWAAVFCLPLLLLGIVWAFANPPGAAPDERDHLVKALAAGRFDIGVEYSGPIPDDPIGIRNASIARTVQIPAHLSPAAEHQVSGGPGGFACTAFDPNQTAACLPTEPPTQTGLVPATTPVGAYPVMLYIPIGWAANLASTPDQAFLFARLASLAMSLAMLYLGVWHLYRWLGRWAATGMAIGLTPMAFFIAASVSTNGIEIMAAAAVAAVAIVVTRHPESLAEPRTLVVLTVTGSFLILSRQLGLVTFSLLAVIALARGGLPVVWRQLRALDRWMIGAGVVLLLSAIIVVAWQLRYDNPALTGPVRAEGGFEAWLNQLSQHLIGGVGRFGWLDTLIPYWAVGFWVVLFLAVVGGALIVGRAADTWTLLGAFGFTMVISFVTYVTVFFPIGAGLQGRHLLSLLVVIPTLGAIVLGEVARETLRPGIALRLAIFTAAIIAPLQFIGLYVNSWRYAVGMDGPVWFAGQSEWSPAGGWLFWLGLALVASVLYAAVIVLNGRISRDESQAWRSLAPVGG